MNFAATRIKTLLEQRRMSQQDLAKALNYSVSKVSRIVNPDYDLPPIETLIDIANYFEVSLDYIIGRDLTMGSMFEVDSRLNKLLKTKDKDNLDIVLDCIDELLTYHQEMVKMDNGKLLSKEEFRVLTLSRLGRALDEIETYNFNNYISRIKRRSALLEQIKDADDITRPILEAELKEVNAKIAAYNRKDGH